MVDLEKDWLAVLVEHDVEAENLKAETVFEIVGLARPVGMTDPRLRTD